MALGAENVQPADGNHFIMLGVGDLLVALEKFVPLRRGDRKFLALVIEERDAFLKARLIFFERRGDPLLQRLLLGHEFGIAAQQNVGAAAGHVGGDGDGGLAARLGHDLRFFLVEFGVEHHVAKIFLFQQF